MPIAPPEHTVEQRRKVLKSALAASGVVTMGYSGSALASFQCVTSTDATGVFGFKKVIDASSNWAWLRLQVFKTNKDNSDWKAVKIPTGSNPDDADEDTNTATYFFQDSTAGGNSPPLYPAGDSNLPSGIKAKDEIVGQEAHVIIYFDTEGSILGFYPTLEQLSGRDYPAQGSCLTSLNPQMDQTNIRYGG